MTPVKVSRGTIVVLEPDPAVNPPVGHEQRGPRPAVIVSDENQRTRFPMFCVVPLTTAAVAGEIYPLVSPSQESGLSRESTALTSDIRGIDPRRIRRVAGMLPRADLQIIEDALRKYLHL